MVLMVLPVISLSLSFSLNSCHIVLEGHVDVTFIPRLISAPVQNHSMYFTPMLVCTLCSPPCLFFPLNLCLFPCVYALVPHWILPQAPPFSSFFNKGARGACPDIVLAHICFVFILPYLVFSVYHSSRLGWSVWKFGNETSNSIRLHIFLFQPWSLSMKIGFKCKLIYTTPDTFLVIKLIVVAVLTAFHLSFQNLYINLKLNDWC